jgi:hypothetical protein
VKLEYSPGFRYIQSKNKGIPKPGLGIGSTYKEASDAGTGGEFFGDCGMCLGGMFFG